MLLNKKINKKESIISEKMETSNSEVIGHRNSDIFGDDSVSGHSSIISEKMETSNSEVIWHCNSSDISGDDSVSGYGSIKVNAKLSSL